MIMEAYISSEIDLLSKEELKVISEGILKTFPKTSLHPDEDAKIAELLIHDKKK